MGQDIHIYEHLHKTFYPKGSRQLPCAYLAPRTVVHLATETVVHLATRTPCLVTFLGIMEVYVGTMTLPMIQPEGRLKVRVSREQPYDARGGIIKYDDNNIWR